MKRDASLLFLMALAASCADPAPEPRAPVPVEGPISATGTILALDRAAGTVTIEHGPIDAIGWSAMTMRFNAADASLLQNVEPGDQVAFELESGANPRTLVALEKQ